MTKKTEKTKPLSLKGSCLWGLLLFAILLLIDLVTKVLAQIYLKGKSVDIIPGWLRLTLRYNDGMAYGMGDNAPAWAKILVIAGTGLLMAIFAVIYFRLDKRRNFLRIALVFVIAGGVGNLIDRIYYRVWDAEALYGVRDMVDLSRFGFAVCNFADFFITGGAVALVLALLFFDKDAVFPVGKYKALAKEAEELKLAKKIEKTETKVDEKNNG